MIISSYQTYSTTKTGQSNFVPERFKPWNDIYQDGKYLIPYLTHEKIANNTQAKDALSTAFEKLESNSSLKFIERTNEEAYLYFNDSIGCKSYIGQQKKSGPQEIILGPGCYYYFRVIHEVRFIVKPDNNLHFTQY